MCGLGDEYSDTWGFPEQAASLAKESGSFRPPCVTRQTCLRTHHEAGCGLHSLGESMWY